MEAGRTVRRSCHLWDNSTRASAGTVGGEAGQCPGRDSMVLLTTGRGMG